MDKKQFDELLESAQEVDDIIEGKKAAVRITEYPEPDVKAIREKLGLNQDNFAMLIGISKRTLKNWEQGRRHPTGPAKALLRIFAVNPELAVKSLRSQPFSNL
ncbi:NadS family protein [Spartinivicinus ruber]|uniref:NadS family protein n=1 Tax=Spartinivicinus ruber TaxID=2683272 RepID=UPI0013D69C04|nr:NadS family protein [Spartinivicinus ruber]